MIYGVILLGLFRDLLGYMIGGIATVCGILVLVYEVIMIALSNKDTERINQSARLLVVRSTSTMHTSDDDDHDAHYN